MTEQNQNPGRKWRQVENEGDGNRFFDTFRFTPYTTDLAYFRDSNIYETKDVARSTQKNSGQAEPHDVQKPRGASRSDDQILEEIQKLLNWHEQIDAKNVQVSVRDGIVNLSGTVDGPNEYRAAEGLVKNVFGVVDVQNQLRIGSPEQ